MALPPLLNLPDEAAYRTHYVENYVRGNVVTKDGVRVFFNQNKFTHAFFESTNRDGNKDQFSNDRAQRMDWIAATLTSAQAIWYQGWDKRRQQYDGSRCATVAFDRFVVVLRFRARRDGVVLADFVTCYHADNSIGKIRQSPNWDLEACRNLLGV